MLGFKGKQGCNKGINYQLKKYSIYTDTFSGYYETAPPSQTALVIAYL